MSVSISLQRSVPDDDGDRDRFDREAIVGLLDDDDAVCLFRSATDPKTVSTLADECDVPLSTAYRKVEKLEDAGLIGEVARGLADASEPARYRRTVDAVTVTLRDGVSVECAVAVGRDPARSQ
ncbi:helix-turn-helix transcriptional regulator [Halostella sp. JP-L12]|uniref:winged helix-turn-helix domain-containing protein n=1 Tax=Halostella TaxID=1843185 RepID=UPI000EF83DE7|nr:MULTISPECIES: helix-turn-helix domain-containing protein [Halostella]NHN49182.1 helix-turn-helix transcriptional regulator [Halostella sp. JP-L12]